MKYLEEKKFYVKNDNNLIYEINGFDVATNYLVFNLNLVAGWDYVNPDWNDEQGWCSSDRFIDDVQNDTVIQYFFEEGLKDALEDSGYTIIENVGSKLRVIIDKYNEEK